MVFEGLDGAGKSTLISATARFLSDRQIPSLVTREPGGTPLGDEIRTLLLRKSADAPSPLTELLLYEAGRSQHVEKVIAPALQKGQWVLCDRFTASSEAFQVGGRGLSVDLVRTLNHIATSETCPDLTILLDLDVRDARKRMENRELDRFEEEKADFHQRVRNNYLEQARQNADAWLVLDASQPADELFRQLCSHLEKKGLLS